MTRPLWPDHCSSACIVDEWPLRYFINVDLPEPAFLVIQNMPLLLISQSMELHSDCGPSDEVSC